MYHIIKMLIIFKIWKSQYLNTVAGSTKD